MSHDVSTVNRIMFQKVPFQRILLKESMSFYENMQRFFSDSHFGQRYNKVYPLLR